MISKTIKLMGKNFRLDVFEGVASNEIRDTKINVYSGTDYARLNSLTTQSFWIQDSNGDINVNWDGPLVTFKPDHKIRALRMVEVKSGKSIWCSVKNMAINSPFEPINKKQLAGFLTLSPIGTKIALAFSLMGIGFGFYLSLKHGNSGEIILNFLLSFFIGGGLGCGVGLVPAFIISQFEKTPAIKEYNKTVNQLMT
jgi:hypothetical protein